MKRKHIVIYTFAETGRRSNEYIVYLKRPTFFNRSKKEKIMVTYSMNTLIDIITYYGLKYTTIENPILFDKIYDMIEKENTNRKM